MPGLRLISRHFPKLKIYVPELKQYRQFDGGVLDLDENDPAFETIRKRAIARPDIDVRKVVGETQGGNPVSKLVKDSAEFICDVCSPAQPFESEAALAAHTADLHTARPILGDEGQDTPATDAPARVRQGTATTRGTAGKGKKKKK